MRHHLAQVNIARLREPLDSPALAGFVAELAPVNALADTAPGFVWRLQTPAGDATSVEAFRSEGADVITNMSVWTGVDALAAFVFTGRHREVMRRRREWFTRIEDAYTACWWLPAGTVPTTGDAEDRIRVLRTLGPTAHSFTLRVSFPPPDAGPDAVAPLVDDTRLCPA